MKLLAADIRFCVVEFSCRSPFTLIAATIPLAFSASTLTAVLRAPQRNVENLSTGGLFN